MNNQPNYNNNQAELIRATIKASMLEVTGKFRDEMTEMLKDYYNREMINRFNEELKSDIAEIRRELTDLKVDGQKTRLDVDKIWENGLFRLALIAGAVYTILQLWQALPHK